MYTVMPSCNELTAVRVFVALTVKLAVPNAVGVPVMRPVPEAAFKFRPVGRVAAGNGDFKCIGPLA